MTLQALGGLVSLALLAWCVHTAWKGGALERFRGLSGTDAWTLAALSLLSLTLNGTLFWVTLAPLKRLRWVDVLAVNAVATFLAYFPFKLSIVWRVLVHHRRDRLPVLTIGAWLIANAAVVLAVLLPPALAGLWRQRVDGPYIAAALGGILVLLLALHAVAVWFGGARGLERLRGLLGRHGWRGRITGSARFERLHEGLGMLAHAPTLAAAAGLRLADLLVQAVRFVVAARAIGESLPAHDAVLIAGVYFLIGVVSPSGAVGAREGGATGLARVLPGVNYAAFAGVALAVSAAEVVVVVISVALALLWLKPWRLLGRGGAEAAGDPRIQ
ncbi:MAG: hypothetical protein DYG92_00795 [Leptolyngbya sp. PLA1]|nr:hypothetical protein [Leptolyngbya sp. PLA1]